ncbi:MAG: STAS domain-containing protein [Solirubrobacteraceae bacterium]
MTPLVRAGRRGRAPLARHALPSMDDNANIDIDIVEYDDLVIVSVEGEVDLCAAPLFEESLAIAAATDVPAIVLDLDRVSFMDSAGVHVLLQFSISEQNRNRLTLTCGSSQVERLLEVTGVRRYLSFGPSPAPELGGGRPTERLHITSD